MRTIIFRSKEVQRHSPLLGIVRDTMEDVKEKLLKALEADVVISTGGVSMGKYDFVKQIYSNLNIDILFE